MKEKATVVKLLLVLAVFAVMSFLAVFEARAVAPPTYTYGEAIAACERAYGDNIPQLTMCINNLCNYYGCH